MGYTAVLCAAYFSTSAVVQAMRTVEFVKKKLQSSIRPSGLFVEAGSGDKKVCAALKLPKSDIQV